MKVFLIIALVACAIVGSKCGNFFTDYDYEKIINDEEQFKAAHACMMDQGPCTEEMQKMKEDLIKILETNCSECKPENKEKFNNAIKSVAEKYPKQLEETMKRYSKAEQGGQKV